MADYPKSTVALENGEKYDLGAGSPPSGSSDIVVEEPEELSVWTRNGCTFESFKRRRGPGVLNHTLRPRHLHMIAIGGSIGAGLFVGSGSALRRGVRKSTAQ